MKAGALVPLVLSVVLGGMAGNALASACDAANQDIRVAVASARLPLDGQKKILLKVDDAANEVATADNNALSAALSILDDAGALLDTSDFKDVAAEQKTKVRAAIAAYASCLRSASRPVKTPVSVRVFTAPDIPASSGILIRVDGSDVATTGNGGTASVIVASGDHRITAVKDINYGGNADVSISAGSNAPIDITIAYGGDYARPKDFVIDESRNGVVPRDFTSFTMRLVNSAGHAVKIKKILRLQLLSGGGDTIDIAPRFKLKGNADLLIIDASAWRALLLDKWGPFDIRIRATADRDTADDDGDHEDPVLFRTYSGSIRFDLGRYHATGSVQVPGGVSVSGIPLRITNQRDGLSFWATTSSSGAIAFSQYLPEGAYTIVCEMVSGNVRYHSYDGFNLDADRSFITSLRSFAGSGVQSNSSAVSH